MKPYYNVFCYAVTIAGSLVAGPKAFIDSMHLTMKYPLETGIVQVADRTMKRHINDAFSSVFVKDFEPLNGLAVAFYSAGGLPGAVVGGELGAFCASLRPSGHTPRLLPAPRF